MPASIRLTRTEISAEQLGWILDSQVYSYPITISAVSNVNFEDDTAAEDSNFGYTANIMVLQASGTGLDPNQGDLFLKVTDVVDLYELPTAANFEAMNENSETYAVPYYRTNTITLYCRSLEEVDLVWRTMQDEVRRFLKNYNLKDQLATSLTTNSETIEI